MKDNLIQQSIKSLFTFVGGTFDSYEWMSPLRTYFGMGTIYVSNLGLIEINRKYDGRFSYLEITDETEVKSILFICNQRIDYGVKRMQFFCIDGEIIYQYKNHNDSFLFTDSEVNGYEGLNIFSVAKKFCEGVVEKELIISDNKLAADIFAHNRKPEEELR